MENNSILVWATKLDNATTKCQIFYDAFEPILHDMFTTFGIQNEKKKKVCTNC